MEEIKTFSLAGHSRMFSMPDSSKDYFFVETTALPYLDEPYRSESYVISFLKEGVIDLQTGLTRNLITGPALITLGPSVIRSFRKCADLTKKMNIIFFKVGYLLEMHPNPFFLDDYDFFNNNERHILHLTAASCEKVELVFELISITHNSSNFHLGEIIRNYLFTLIYDIDDYYRQQPSGTPAQLNTYPLFAKFKELLTSHYLQERKLNFYADQLHVTAKYLSATLKKQTGKSAADWIDEMIILEAKVLLQNKMLTVSQISNQLNFLDQSIFGKFFKANTGYSPVQYRKKN